VDLVRGRAALGTVGGSAARRGRSLTYTWSALADDLELFGHPAPAVQLTADRPIAYLSAKVTDVFPDGELVARRARA
jgi:predicted acyl esterase